jgi:hypothetical protein
MMGAAPKFRLIASRIALATALAASVAATSWAQDAKAPDAPAAPPPVTITPPADPVAKAAFDALDRNCARCHQAGKLVNRERPAKGFGNILKLDELAANPHLIHPGNPLDSFVMKQILDKQMPYDVYQELSDKYPGPSEADVKALEAWVNSLGEKALASCESHKPITPDDMVSYMVNDLNKQLKQRQYTTRYLTLTHLANICVPPETMKVYRQAAIKFLNSLGRSSDVVRLETIDPEGTIMRFNLVDLGWSAADYEVLVGAYPYNVQPDSDFSRTLAEATRTSQPYLRADWFTFTVSQPPLYDVLLKLPNTFQELTRQQGINVEADIANFVAQRAAFQKSGVSQNNRLIERHPSRSGYFWTSYDFAGNRDHQSLFDFPLGPSVAGFHHDGGETIFSLPNGFQGYYLNKATGERLDKGPTTIVRDEARRDFTVTDGISCMGCHDQGMRKAKDEIRGFVLGRKTFSSDIRDAVDGLYPPHEKMDAFIEGDQKRFTAAMVQAGLDPTLKLNGVEMINALAKQYENDLDLTLAVAELGITKADFKDAAGDVDARFRPVIRRLLQGAIPRDQWELDFRDLALQLTDLKTAYAGNAHTPGYTPSHAPSYTPPALVRPIHNEDLVLTSDADSYHIGDGPVFTVVSPRDCFLTLTDVDEKGAGTVLLPNAFQQDNRIKAGEPIQFPGTGAPFKYRMKDPGTETIVAVCATTANGGDHIQHDFKRSQFTEIPNYDDVLGKSIAIDPVGPGAQRPVRPSPSSAPEATARPSFRAAIRVGVR